MPVPNTDRNLLIGILALQMDFISRDQLVAAMGVWVLDKSQSLDQVLVASKAIDASTRDLILALVDKHLELHQGDPQQSLAALSSVGVALREELKSLADPQIEATIAIVGSQRTTDSIPSELESMVSLGQASTEVRFRILRPHAKGGLGKVSVALDQELHREVALKEIQEQHADQPESRARFLLEAEVTGGLEHPGIVPVYGLGTYGNGRPFYAMRFIRGDSLKEAADRFHQNDAGKSSQGLQSLAFRQLLGRFVDVCQAMEYAHSRGVLHRDLKPGNIMLGKYGETLIVDWGLSKVVGREDIQSPTDEPTLKPSSGSGAAPTQMGSAVGTPQYMSPEQADRHLDLLGRILLSLCFLVDLLARPARCGVAEPFHWHGCSLPSSKCLGLESHFLTSDDQLALAPVARLFPMSYSISAHRPTVDIRLRVNRYPLRPAC